mgnify:FL=1
MAWDWGQYANGSNAFLPGENAWRFQFSGHTFHFWRETCADCQVKAVWRASCLFGLLERTNRSSAFMQWFPLVFVKLLVKRRISAEEVLAVCLLRKEVMESDVVEKFLRRQERETRRKLLWWDEIGREFSLEIQRCKNDFYRLFLFYKWIWFSYILNYILYILRFWLNYILFRLFVLKCRMSLKWF